ncbi:hypothetical protein ONS95_000997 [Cadophora gregata]|uniref:uncharacterized protein n=1 Tax=Cadophora gregata TaxID=51156 RepID=UPI0026DC3BCE|nr:uncharacterized protein ONS95_000997 [Cadophora gregata]KAK0129056.1 hypothetical protein ONS95_000997 [Cadophora gregata]
MMAFNRTNIRTVEECYMSDPMDQASGYLDIGPGTYGMSPQLCNSVNINTWPFSPLSSPESPYLSTPLSSTYQDSSWNPFDRNFGSLITPNSTGFNTREELATKAYNNVPGFQQTEPGPAAPVAPHSSCVSASQTSATLSNVCSPNENSNACSVLDVHTGSGGFIPTRKTSACNTKHNKQSRSQHEPGPTKKSAPQQRLRSTSTAVASSSRPNVSSTSSYSSNSPPKHTRLNHNHVEKQYRNRLNGQFETLLLALPREGGADGNGRKVSKAEVLVLARKYIRDLERGRKRLEEENERLVGRMGVLKKRWTESGGVLLP